MIPKESAAGRPRLALIGPVLPFRGGIAQHTTMLHRAAGRITDLLTVSFTRQYPRWLFPGEDDQDAGYAGHREPGVEYLIDSLNPLTWRRAADRVLAHRPDLVVIPWWTIFWAACFGYLRSRFTRAGVDVLFLCHNVVDHEAAHWKIALSRQVLKGARGYLVQSEEDGEALQQLLPGAEVLHHPHPLYDQFPAPRGDLPRRGELELLFFGFVRPYKGLDILIEALSRVDPSVDFRLTVAGEFWQGKEEIERLIAEKSLGDRVEVLGRYLPEQEVAELFRRADVVVLPYRSATGSGVIPLAYHYDTPVIVTRVGGLPGAVDEGRTGLVVPPEDPGALAEAISSFTREKREAMAANIESYKKKFTWEGMVGAILQSASCSRE